MIFCFALFFFVVILVVRTQLITSIADFDLERDGFIRVLRRNSTDFKDGGVLSLRRCKQQHVYAAVSRYCRTKKDFAAQISTIAPHSEMFILDVASFIKSSFCIK